MAVIQPNIVRINSTATQSQVGEVVVRPQNTNTKFYSSRVLNYVESSEVGGYLKTVFYTEVNTNVNVGDRIFILNGNYDSNLFIEQDKYRKYSDGYRVLNVDGCKITLDIDYTGELPYRDSTTRDFILLHHIRTQEEFDYINSIKISVGGQSVLKSTFSGYISGEYLQLDTQGIIYVSNKFDGSSDSNNLNSGVGGEGFWVRSDVGVQNTWVNVTNFVFAGKIKQNAEFSTSGNLYIIGEDFTFNNVTFNQRTSYKYENYSWVIDIRYKNPYLSKTNFRFGKFDGTHNDGVFGTYLKKSFWDGAIWNSGSFVYSDWNSGVMNSKHTVEETSYLSKIQDNVVVQTIDFSNNKGFGYNFIQDSLFGMSIINNGNFLNCNFITSSSTFSAIDNYFGFTMSTLNNVNGGKLELCDVYDIKSNGGYFLNSAIYNSNLNKSKLVNSEVINSDLNNGFWSNEGGIKVVGADIWSYDYNPGTILDGTQSDINGTLKLYISEEDYFKLNKGDAFYISKINKDYVLSSLDDDQKILFPLESRYLLENFYDFEISPGVRNLISVSLKSSHENKYKHYVNSSKTRLDYYEYVINGEASAYWYKIPMNIDETNGFEPQLRYGWNSDYATSSTPYILGDFVYMLNSSDLTIWDFYLYWPINKGDVNDNRVGWRADYGDLVQAELYGQAYRQFSPIDNNGTPWGSDWIWVGTFSNDGVISLEASPTSGLWDRFATYSGGFTTEIPGGPDSYFAPSYPFGNIVRDNDIDNNFYIFVGGDYDLTNSTKSNLIGFDYLSENFATQSNISSPSIDITSKLFGWYRDREDNTILSKNNKISPITPDNANELFVNTILGNGDFKSGIMSNSTWLSGDNSNYYANILPNIINTNNFNISKSGNNLRIELKNNSYLDRTSLNTRITEGYDIKKGDYLWIKSINYNLNGDVISIDGRYKVLNTTILGGSGINSLFQISIESSDNKDIISGLTAGGTYSTPLAQTNNYLSIHKFYLTDSKIISGKFRRTGLNNCVFQNQFFKKYENSGNAITNTELIRLINIMFNRTKNEVKSGLVYKSHFVDDIFNGGTFYNSIWLGGTFSDGLFKSSVWTGGNFNGGRFIDSREPTVFSFDFDSTNNNKLWQGGNFNGGEFFNSIWANGTFNNGRFYKSDWYGGIWNNGILGSKTLSKMDTTLAYYGPTSFGATFTIWNNGLVENAMVGGDGALDWYNGKIIGGEFTSNDTTPQRHSTWHDGEFYGSSFTEKAWWKNGSFFGGKFLSNIGWDKASFLTHSESIEDYGWVDGKFYGGEFGNGLTGTNSIWYNGVMSGGVFQGRFWRDGIFNNGKFYGSLVTQSDISQSLLPFTHSFYGLWNDGKVTSLVSQVKTDEITSTRREVQSTNLSLGKVLKKQLNIADMYGVLWKNGTFSNELGSFNNSVWINGEFNLGNFNDSYFNPFVDLSLSGIPIGFYRKSDYLKTIYSLIQDIVVNGGYFSPSSFLEKILRVVNDFNSSRTDSDFINKYDHYQSPYDGDYDFTQELTENYDDIDDDGFDEENSVSFLKIYDPKVIGVLPGDYIGIRMNYLDSGVLLLTVSFEFPNENRNLQIPYNFSTYSTCVWTGGNFNSGEFNYSKWLGGNFNDGAMNGAIWLDGTFNYGYMNNSYWENGTWRNGNWNGAPFDYTTLGLSVSEWVVSDKRVNDILTNINNYVGGYKMHLSNVITQKDTKNNIHLFTPNDGFLSWTFSVDDQNTQ